MLRVAGLPVESVQALRHPAGRRWADDVLAAEERLRTGADGLSDLLHEAVRATDLSPAGPGGAQRRALLALRRQIFNNRLPTDPEAALRLVAGLGPDTARRLADWLRDRRDLEELRAGGEPLLAAGLAATRAALRGLLTEDRLRRGLLLASPTLEGQLDTYAAKAAAGTAPDKRMRKIERSALSYLYRTACKTSPFSTFTGIAAGVFDEHGPEDLADAAPVAGVDDRWSSHVRLNVVVLARFTELVLADPARRGDLPVRPASGWEHENDRIRYVRQWAVTGDDAAAVTFDAVKDRLFYLRRSGTLDRLLSLFDGRDDLRYGDLVRWLRTEHDAEPEECETYVAALLQLGLVRVDCLDTDVHSPDPLRSYRDALGGLGRPWADGLAAALEGPARAVERYASADRAERAGLLRELRAGLSDAQRLLLPAGHGGADGERAATLPRTLLYEDVRAGREVTCRLGAWTGADGWAGTGSGAGDDGGALRRVESILPAFDLTLPQRITFQGFFTARYGRGGRCDDLLGLVHDFHEDFFDQYLSFAGKRRPFDERGDYVPEENWLGLPGIRALDAARQAFIARMRRAWAARTEHGPAEPIRLDDADLAPVADALAPLAGHFVPRTHHIQLAHDNGARLTVLNRSYGGLSFPFSRFTHVYDSTGPGGSPEPFSRALREDAAARTPDGAVLAEITGGAVTSNLNLHGRLTEYEIVCPGEVSTVPEDRRLHLDDLYAEHDADADRLVLRSERLGGTEVVPAYLGYLVPLALPEIPRTLLLMSPTSMSPVDVWAGVPEGEPAAGVTIRPRVLYGDVVLSRRSWTTTAGVLPAPGPGTGEHERFLAWQRFRRTHGLPDQVFATVSGGPRGGAGAKPQYVDFDSPLSLSAFEALLTRPDDRVVLREALPGADGPYVRTARGRHVAELAVETFTWTRRTKGVPTCQS
ncbi:hypothetical protein GCM10009654_63750 [Streptomyces hebeiensis]|uniref:Lantibiotic dehydratase N-terminal domain-containing protein n=1 Tax=Streptomyces hebeiensis TaxID=229486 RepID=A0ABP4FSE6_9ACTN